MSRLSSSLLGAAVLLAGTSSVTFAQGKGHGGGGAAPARAPEVHEAKPAKMDHESAMGAAHEGMKGDKDRMHDMQRATKRQDDAAGRAEKRQDEVAGRAAKRQDKMAKHAAKAEDRAEHNALREAHQQSTWLVKGAKLSGDERRQVRAIDKKYEAQIRALRKEEKAADKMGADNDAAYNARVTALTTQERAEIRAVLSPTQQARFDANVAARAAMKH